MLRRIAPVPMHGVVRYLSKIPRLSSLAGNGLPERMRTTAFAFLGLTAAAGLALVAIFAQLSFHVLSPAPLPDASQKTGSVAAGVPLRPQGRLALAGARDAAIVTPATGASSRSGFDPGRRRGQGSVDGPAVPLPGRSAGPAPASPEPSETAPSPDPVPAPESAESPAEQAPTAAPVSNPLPEPASEPGKSTAVVPGTDKEKPRHDHPGAGHGWESHPKPEKQKPPKPSKPEPPKPEADPAPEPAYESAPPPTPKDKGQDKKDKKDK